MSEVSTTAARGLRSIRPSDLAAWDSLESRSPVVAAALSSAVIERCARLKGPSVPDVTSVALLTVARHYASTGTTTHAVARAVRLAIQQVTAANSDAVEVPFDPTDSSERTRIEVTSFARPDVSAQTNDQREAFRALLARAGESVADEWEGIANAWLSHVAVHCSPCQRPGARPGRIGLSNVRSHMRGYVTGSGPDQASRKQDRATVAAVAAVLAPMVAARPEGPVVWGADRGDLWAVFGLAWSMVQHGDDLSPVSHVDPGGTVRVSAPVPLIHAGTYSRAVSESEGILIGAPMTRRATLRTGERVLPAARDERASHAGEAGEGVDGPTVPNRQDVTSAGTLRAFKPVVSSRKRAAGQTGPTVTGATVTAGMRDSGDPREHDATRGDRYAASLAAGRAADHARRLA